MDKNSILKNNSVEIHAKQQFDFDSNDQIYANDDKEELKQGSPCITDEDDKLSSDDDMKDDQDILSFKPKKNQYPALAKLKIFVNISPADFLEIKKQFSNFNNTVNVTEALVDRTSLHEQLNDYIHALVELYQMIDLYDQKSITFDQLSNFLVEMHEILGRDQNLFEIRLRQKQINSGIDNISVEKLFDLQGYDGFGYLEQNQKTIHLTNSKNFQEQFSISIGQTTIISAQFFKKQNALMLTSNDKFIHFFDFQTQKLIRRFMTPEVQTFIQVSKKKGLIYTGTISGKIYTWQIEKIFSKEFLKAMSSINECYKLVLKGEPLQVLDQQNSLSKSKSLGVMLLIEGLDKLATGSSDSIIRLFENKTTLLSSHKQLKGHKKLIKGLSYCAQYKYLISCSYDFDVLIWNIHLDHPLVRLIGHEAPLISILTIQELKPHRFSLILSCDAKGILKVWDPKTFQNLQQIVLTDQDQRVKSLVYKSEISTVMLVYRKLLTFEIDQSFDQNLTDDNQISCFCFSKQYLEIHISTAKNIKTWDAQRGSIKRILKGIDEGDITTMVLDHTERRLFVGFHYGKISVIDIFTGFKLSEITDFNKELCNLSYSNQYKLLISVGWDKQIRIYNDSLNQKNKMDKDNSLRIIKNAHQQDIVASAFSENLSLIATSTREGELRLWDFEKGHFIYKLNTTGKEMIALRFLDPYPILITSDISGTLSLQIVQPHKLEGQAAIVWKNMFTIMKAAQVQCFCHFFDNQLVCLLGDENGDVRLIDFSEVFDKLDLVPYQMIVQNRNLHRFFQLNFQEYQSDIPDKPLTVGLINEKHARQIGAWKAHKSGIKMMQIINQTEVINLITLAYDRLIKIWNMKGQLMGVLRQGNDANLKTSDYNISFKIGYKKKDDQIFDEVIQKYEFYRNKRQNQLKYKLKKNKNETDPSPQLAHIDSSEIFKDLQEINKYLDMRSKQNDQKAKIKKL